MRGFEQVKSKLNAVPDKMLQAGKAGLNEVGKNILNESQGQVPVDTGTLKASGRMEESGSAKKFTVTVSYNTDYAIFVHEITRYYHTHGSAKFLENPFTRWANELPRIIESYLRGML